jgi:hypothetical protein
LHLLVDQITDDAGLILEIYGGQGFVKEILDGTKIMQPMRDCDALAPRAKYDRDSRGIVSATQGGKGVVPLIDTHNTVY